MQLLKYAGMITLFCGFLPPLCPEPVEADKVLMDLATLPKMPRSSDATLKVSIVEDRGVKVLLLESDAGRKFAGSWPEVSVAAPESGWDLSAYGWVEMDVRNRGTTPATVILRVCNKESDYKNNSNTGRRTLPPGARDTVRVPLRKRMSNHEPLDFGELSLSYPLFSNSVVRTIDPKCVIRLVVMVERPYQAYPFAVEVGPIRARGTETLHPDLYELPKEPFPFIDVFGQFAYDDWENKILRKDDFRKHLDAETADLARHLAPSTWNRYGGWEKGPRLTATGHFRTEKYGEKWWLVDPEGRLFFSMGVNGLNMWSCTTQIVERKHWFQTVPGEVYKAELRVTPFRSKAVFGEVTNVFNANLEHKYGRNWQEVWVDRTLVRMRSWGLNTIGQGAQSPFYQAGRTAYTVNLSSGGKRIEASSGPWSKFPDVFDPSFEPAIKARLRSRILRETISDPWCIGYFSDNELAWGSPITHALWILSSPAEQTAKKVFADDLIQQYGNDIASLNKAWNRNFTSWNDFLARADLEPPFSAPMIEDMVCFSRKTIERYFVSCRRAIKEAAPDKLYLGVRFAGEVRPEVADLCAKYCDVVSYNLYKSTVEGLHFPTDHDKPLMATEFNISCVEPRYFHGPGYLHAGYMTREERAAGFRSYVEGALRDPRFVGCHWHRYMDDPPTGNLIGENGQWGFIDVCDTPYASMVTTSRELAEELYEYRLKKSSR